MKNILVQPTADIADASFVFVNGEPCHVNYARSPSEVSRADDVILEAQGASGEIVVTLSDVVQDTLGTTGELRLKSGIVLSFVSAVTIH